MECQESKLFEGVTHAECARMLECFGAWQKSFSAGQPVLTYDTLRDTVCVMLSGSAELVRFDVDGNRTILESLEEGSVFGEVLAFSGTSGDGLVVECREESTVLFLRYDQITKRCENACTHHSILVQNLFRLLSTKTLRLSERVEVLSCRSIREKLLCYFSQQAQHAKSRSFLLPFSLSSLADYISADRSAMMRELKKLREEGVVRTGSRRVTLLR